MENVISTVENSVSKMNRLLARMREGAQADSRNTVDLARLLEEAVRDARSARPVPGLECNTHDLTVSADRDQLASVMGHMIRNAQDATAADGGVIGRVQRINGHAVVEVEDNGCG